MKLAGLVSCVIACSTPQRARVEPRTALPVAHPAAASRASGAATDVQQFASAESEWTFADANRRVKLEGAFPAIDKAMAEQLRAMPGFAVSIVIDGDIAYAKGFGVADLATKTPATPDTVYRIGSVTKSFTGLALISLRDDGALRLDDPLTTYMPEAAKLIYPTRDARPITLRQLATHTAGLPRDGTYGENNPDEAAVVASLAGVRLENAPGAVHAYSNLGYSLLGIVVGRAAKSSLHDVIRKRIFVPAGMTSTYWASKDVPTGRLATNYGNEPRTAKPKEKEAQLGASDGDGGIYSTARDMARYAALQLSAYPPRNAPDDGPISRASLREAHSTGVAQGAFVRTTATAAAGQPTVELRAMSYGFGWVREQGCERERVWHNGAIDSYRSDVHFWPRHGVAVVVLSNFDNTDAIVSRIVDELAKTGALVERKQLPTAQYVTAADQLLAVQNTWDEAAYHAMFDAGRDEATAIEKEELAGYKALHGACKRATPLERVGNDAKFAFECERGSLVMTVQLSNSGKLGGFFGTSQDIAAPPDVTRAVDGLLALTATWNDATYRKYLTRVAPIDVVKQVSRDMGATHGRCHVSSTKHVGLDWSFTLACARGGAVVLDASVGKDGAFDRALVHPPRAQGNCPVN